MSPDPKTLTRDQLEAIATLAFSTAEDWHNADGRSLSGSDILDAHVEGMQFHVDGYEPEKDPPESDNEPEEG